MKKGFLKVLFRGLTICLASVFTLCIGLSVGAKLNEADINENLGTSSRELVQDSDSVYASKYGSWQEMTAAKHANIKETMAEGIVLLKNDGVLPLSEGKYNVFGANSANAVYGGGGGAGVVSDPNVINVKTAFDAAGIDMNDELYDFYANVPAEKKRKVGGRLSDEYATGEINPSEFSDALKGTFTENGTTAIVWLARCIGEGTDPAPGFMALDENEKALLEYVKGLSHIQKIVVVLNEDNTMGVGPLAFDDRINAIVHVGGMGINGSEALAEILLGKKNPSGHLTDTYAASSLSSPAAQNMYDHVFSNAAEVEAFVGGVNEYATKYIAAKEGIYVGYRYYETRYEDSVLGRYNAKSASGVYSGASEWDYAKEVCYPFGHGLSYTTFTQTLDSVKVEDGTVTAKVTVKNTGDRAGKSVVQLYAQAPYIEGGVEKSAVQLMNFAKTKEIPAGDTDSVTIECPLEFLASYDYKDAKTYILDAGTYYFAIGDDAHDALNNIIAKKSSAHSSLGNAEKVYDGYKLSNRDMTYSKSTITGKEITNLFDDADYNYFYKDDVSKQIKYLTRADWTTFPTTEDSLTATDEMMKLLSGQEAKSGVDYSDGDYDDVDAVITSSSGGKKGAYPLEILYGVEDYDDPSWNNVLNQMTIDEMVTFLQGNSLTRPIETIGYLGSVDGDGPAGFSGQFDSSADKATALTARVYQSQCTLASTWNQELAYKEGEFMGEDGLYLGKTSIWAPGANLHRTPYSARNFEYYSEDSMMAYWMGAKQCNGLQDKGCIACPKHFAFNDQEKNRCSLVNFVNEQQARELQLRSFQGSFTIGRAMGTMTSFSRIGCVYAGASHALMTDILRGEWGFKGYTITDYAAPSWGYMHSVESLKAGTDLFDTTADFHSVAVKAAIEKGDKVALAALREANKRVLYAIVNSHAVTGKSVAVIPWWLAAIISVDVIIGVFTLAALSMYIVFAVKAKA